MSETYDPTAGVITDYSGMLPLPVMNFNTSTNSIIFNNPIAASGGFTSATAGSSLIFSDNVIFNNSAIFGDSAQVPPTSIPDNPTNLYLPTIASGGVIQTTDILVCNSTVSQFYCGTLTSHFYNDLYVDGNIINTNLSTLLNNISSNSNSSISSLSSIYQPIGSYALTSAITSLSSIYQRVGSYALTSAITGLSSIYQRVGSYITSSTLTSTLSSYALSSSLSAYQTVANMSNYITSSTLTSSLSSYALSSSLSGYQPKAWLSANIAVDGTPISLGGVSGIANVNHTMGSGIYAIFYSTPAPTVPSACFVQIRSSTGFINFSGVGLNSIVATTFSVAGANTDKAFSIMVFL